MKKISAYLTASMIALAGLGVLVFSVWYIISFPVPHPLQPLKQRIVVALQLEKIREAEISFVIIDQDQVPVYQEPDENSVELTKISSGAYQELTVVDDWHEIEIDQEIKGWVNKKFIKGR
jgi:hypothetical protein